MKYLAILLCASLLSACGLFRDLYGFDAKQLDTANKQMAFAYSQIDGLTDLTTGLLEADVISTDQAERVAAKLRDAFGILETTRAALALSGDPFAAQSEIERATAAIKLALSLLQEFAPRQTALYLEGNPANEFRAYPHENAKRSARAGEFDYRRHVARGARRFAGARYA